MNPIPTWRETLGNSPTLVAAGAVGQAMQQEIDTLKEELAAMREQKPFAWYDPSADKFTRDRDDPSMNRGATLWRLFLDAPQMESLLVANEREQCARLCDEIASEIEFGSDWFGGRIDAAEDLAARIRARAIAPPAPGATEHKTGQGGYVDYDMRPKV